MGHIREETRGFQQTITAKIVITFKGILIHRTCLTKLQIGCRVGPTSESRTLQMSSNHLPIWSLTRYCRLTVISLRESGTSRLDHENVEKEAPPKHLRIFSLATPSSIGRQEQSTNRLRRTWPDQKNKLLLSWVQQRQKLNVSILWEGCYSCSMFKGIQYGKTCMYSKDGLFSFIVPWNYKKKKVRIFEAFWPE